MSSILSGFSSSLWNVTLYKIIILKYAHHVLIYLSIVLCKSQLIFLSLTSSSRRLFSTCFQYKLIPWELKSNCIYGFTQLYLQPFAPFSIPPLFFSRKVPCDHKEERRVREKGGKVSNVKLKNFSLPLLLRWCRLYTYEKEL